MKSRLNNLLMVALTLMPLFAGCKTGSTEAADSRTALRVQRGQYLVTAIGCNDCHTPLKMTERGPEPGAENFALYK